MSDADACASLTANEPPQTPTKHTQLSPFASHIAVIFNLNQTGIINQLVIPRVLLQLIGLRLCLTWSNPSHNKRVLCQWAHGGCCMHYSDASTCINLFVHIMD